MTRKEKAYKLGQMCFPDECNVWARANVEAQWVSEACVKMAEWEHQRLVDKGVEWLQCIDFEVDYFTTDSDGYTFFNVDK